MATTEYDDTDHEIARLLPDVISAERRQDAIRAGNDSPTTGELLAGSAFRDGSLESDCAIWASRLLYDCAPPSVEPPLPPRVQRALRQVSMRPTFSALTALHKAASYHRDEWNVPFRSRLLDVRTRADIYLWHSGDEAAATRCALEALSRLRQTVCQIKRVGLLATALSISTSMNFRGIDALFGAAALMGELQRRTARPPGMQAWLNAYNDATIPGVPDELPPPVAEDDEIDLMAAVREDRDRGAWAYAQPEPQSRIVFGVMDHLPRVSQSARERGDTPRAVVANLEGVPLPLKRLEIDIARVAFELHAGFPWMPGVVDDVVMELAMAPSWIELPRIILEGGPGSGKTSFAIALCAAVGIPATVYSAAGVADGAFAGTSRQWSTGRICVPGQAIIQARIANPVIVLDEVEKAGTSRHNGNLTDTLLAMTEPTSSRVFHDPYLEAPIDLSAVSYLGTVNDADLLPTPLRDRFRIVHVPAPGVEHLPAITKGMIEQIRTKRGCRPELLPELAPDEIEIIARDWKPGSMRGLRRRVEIILSGRDRLATRN